MPPQVSIAVLPQSRDLESLPDDSSIRVNSATHQEEDDIGGLGSETDTLRAYSQWELLIANFDKNLRKPRAADAPPVPANLIRDWAFRLEAQNEMHTSQLQELAQSPMTSSNPTVRIFTEQISLLRDRSKSRINGFISSAKTFQASDEKNGENMEADYFWSIDLSSFVDEQIQYLFDLIISMNEIPPPGSPGITAVERPFDPDPKLRGLSETSNTRARDWMSRKLYGKVRSPLDGRNAGAGAATVAMSTVGSYKATLATLAAIAFLGASLAWSAVFTGARGDLVVLAWSSAAFSGGAVAAAAMGIVVEGENIDLDRDMGARRVLRIFGMMSASMTLVGIILLGVATASVDPTYSDTPNLPVTLSRKRSMQAAGWFIVALSLIEVSMALLVRFYYHKGRWTL